jgi:hypothetical protein
MLPWQKQQKLDHICTKESACEGWFEGIGLISHLETKGKGCVLHYGVLTYLHALYGNLNGCGHKFLYKLGDDRYKRALEAEEISMKKLA